MPSKLLQESLFNFVEPSINKQSQSEKEDKNKPSKESKDKVSWLSLFAELDPLANPPSEGDAAGDRA